MKCPECGGKGQVVRHGTVFLTCPSCHGVGRLTREQVQRTEQSKLLEDLRVSLGWCMADAAEACRVTVLLYNDAEHGRVDPTPYLQVLKCKGARTAGA